MPSVTVSATIPLEDWQAMNRIIIDKKYKTQSEFIRIAIRKHLGEKQEE
jgi:Arc/MetJ-type ribon-helix-helix transcriptional regulator